MNFILLGDLPEAAFLARAIHSTEAHALRASCVSGRLQQQLALDGVAFTSAPSPEDALTGGNVDCVIVAAGTAEESINLTRQASQGGAHVIVFPPDDCSTAFSYEIHLLLDESQHGIVPFYGRWYLNPTAESTDAGLPAAETIRQFNLTLPYDDATQERRQLDGADLLSSLGFQYDQITGLNVPGADGQIQTQTITLAASQKASTTMPPAMLSFHNNADSPTDAALQLESSNRETTALPTALPAPQTSSLDANGALERAIVRLENSQECQRGMEEFSNALELMMALAKSFRRRRTVDVYFDAVSERKAFKTQMTAFGCLILTYLLFGSLGYLIVEKLITPPGWILLILRILLVVPIVLFIFAQFLLPLARERGHNANNSE